MAPAPAGTSLPADVRDFAVELGDRARLDAVRQEIEGTLGVPPVTGGLAVAG
jgi:hypothetical protein